MIMPYLWSLSLICAVVIYAVLDYLQSRKRWKRFEKVPGLKPRPIVGNVPLYRLITAPDITAVVSALHQVRLGLSRIFQEQGLYHFWVGRKPFVVLIKAETAEVVLSSHVSIDKSDIYRMGKEWFGEGLATSTGEAWRHDRKQLTPAFNFRILEDFLPIMNEQAAILVQKLKTIAVGRPWIDLQEHARRCALDVILETSMGIRAGAQKRNSAYTSTVQSFTTMLTKRVFRPWLHSNLVYYLTRSGREYLKMASELNRMTDKLIEKRRLERKQAGKIDSSIEDHSGVPVKKRLALLDLLLEAGLSDQQLREQVSTFVFAGHHTISMSVVWVLYMVGLYPEVQAKLLEEMDSVFGQDVTREATQDDLKQLKYMSRVMKETQRLYPTAPVIARKLVEDTKIGEHVIPAGTDCVISIASIHLDFKTYPDPERFDPDRFLPENSAGRNPYAFVPFSAGPRNCIGQRYAESEIKVILCHLLRAFRFRSLDPRDKVKVIPDINLRPFDKLRMEITHRNYSGCDDVAQSEIELNIPKATHNINNNNAVSTEELF